MNFAIKVRENYIIIRWLRLFYVCISNISLQYGMSSSLLLELLRQKWSLDTELPLQRDLDYFLRTRMADQVEYLDGLYRYRFVQRNLQVIEI